MKRLKIFLNSLFFLLIPSIAYGYTMTTSTLYNLYTPNTLTFTFTNTPTAAGNATLSVYALGDFNSTSEYAVLKDENGNVLANLFGGTNQSASQVSATVSLAQASINSWIANGSINFSLTPTTSVGNIGTPYAYMSLSYSDLWNGDAVIANNTGSVNLGYDPSINSLTLGSGNALSFTGNRNLTITKNASSTSGKLTLNSNMTLSSGSQINFNNGGQIDGTGTLTNQGTITGTGGTTAIGNLSKFINAGILQTLSGGILNMGSGTLMNANGILKAINNTVNFSAASTIQGGNVQINTNGRMNASSNLNLQSALMNMNSGGNLAVSNVFTIDNASSLLLGTSRDTLVQANQIINNGLLKGSGTLDTAQLVSNGTLAIGNSPGLVNITGDLVLQSANVTEMEIWGSLVAGTDYDRIVVTGNVTYGGILDIILDLTKVSISQIVNMDLITFGGTASGSFSQIRFWSDAAKTMALTGLHVNFNQHSLSVTSIPEPSTCFLFALAILAFLGYRPLSALKKN